MTEPVSKSQAGPLAPRRARPLRGLARALRPHQWIKNLFVLAPLFFAKLFVELGPLSRGLAAAGLFCLTAGTVYLVNDLFDVDKDRRHPTKRRRPIASGELPIGAARAAAAILGPGSIALGFWLDARLGATLAAYLIMNLAYSAALKHIAFVDVAIIATGFVLRVLAGAFGVGVRISEWLIACTFLLALYLGLGKRLHELALVEQGRSENARPVLARYRAEHLDFAALTVAGSTIAAYTIYTLTASLPDQPLRASATPFASPYLPATIPFSILGIVRFYQLLRSPSLDAPTELILRDLPFIVNLALWGAVMVAIAFFG